MGCDEITSPFVAVRTNLLPSNSLIHADGGMATVGSESVSSLTINPFLTGLPREGTVRDPTMTHSLVTYLKLKRETQIKSGERLAATISGNPCVLQLCLHEMTLLLLPHN